MNRNLFNIIKMFNKLQANYVRNEKRQIQFIFFIQEIKTKRNK